MNPSQNNLKQNDGGEENITTEIKTKLTKTECVNITKKWIRNCLECNKLLEYKHWEMFRRANKKNGVCNSCSRRNKKQKLWDRICPVCNNKISHTTKFQMLYSLNKPCKDCSHKGLKYNKVKKVYSDKELTRKCPNCRTPIKYSNIRRKN